jgi:hypothetical protein
LVDRPGIEELTRADVIGEDIGENGVAIAFRRLHAH